MKQAELDALGENLAAILNDNGDQRLTLALAQGILGVWRGLAMKMVEPEHQVSAPSEGESVLRGSHEDHVALGGHPTTIAAGTVLRGGLST